MKKLNATNDINYLRIDLTGSGYTSTLEAGVKEIFRKDAIEAVVRGQHELAAGPELWMDVVIEIVSSLAVEGIKYVVQKVRSAISESLSISCCVNSVIVESPDSDCDFVIRSNSAAGMLFEEVDLTSIVSRMRELVESERSSGRYISKVEAPCDLRPTPTGMSIHSNGVGSYSLWLLSYREGERWPHWLYDAANEVFVPLEDDSAIINSLNSVDAFYTTK